MLNNLKSSFFGKIFGVINIVSRLESAFNSGAMLGDWLYFEKEIEYCFTKNSAEISECLDLSGVWIMDLALDDYGLCDETHFEDEAHIPPTFHFNSDGTITFDTDPVDSELNGPDFINTYNLSGNILTINSIYSDENQTDLFEATLEYINSEFVGNYDFNWNNETFCNNSILVARQ